MKNKIVFPLVFFTLIFLAVSADAKNIIKIGRDINISEGQQVDSVITVGGQITISGLVEKNVVSIGGSVVLTSEAVVRGNVLCIGGVVVLGRGAQIFGKITEVTWSSFLAAVSSAFYDDEEEWSWLTDIIYFCFYALLFTLALLTALLFPHPLKAIIISIEENRIKSFFCGIFGALMIAPFFTLMLLSFVGIPLIPIIFPVILLSFMFGFIAVSALLGKIILMKVFRYHKPSLVRETLLGLIIWCMISWAPFYIGIIIRTTVMAIGFGGVLLAVFGRGYHPQNPVV